MKKQFLIPALLPLVLFLFSFHIKSGTLQSIFEQKWVSQKYGDPAIQLESPDALQPTSLELPEEVKNYIVKMNMFQYQHDALLIMANTINYKPEITASLQGAANGSVNEMKNRPGVTKFTYVEKTETISGKEGIIQSGTFNAGDDKLDFHNIITVEGANMWQVFVAYNHGDAYGLKVKDKLLKSIKL